MREDLHFDILGLIYHDIFVIQCIYALVYDIAILNIIVTIIVVFGIFVTASFNPVCFKNQRNTQHSELMC